MPDVSRPEISLVLAVKDIEEHIQRVVRSLDAAGRATGRAYELLVVDDTSEDQTVAIVRNWFPEVRLLVNPQESGRAATCNRGVEQAFAPVVVLVQQATTLPVELIRELAAPFFAPSAAESAPVFAVGARVQDRSGAIGDIGGEAPVWGRGGVYVETQDTAGQSSFLRFSVAAVSRDLFLKIGGFETFFHTPAWQDRDLAYRASKAGWRCVHQPERPARQDVARWGGEHDFSRAGAAVRERDRLGFNYLNIHDFFLSIRLFTGLMLSPLLGTGRRDVSRFRILAGLVPAALWPVTLRQGRRMRRAEAPPVVRCDRDLLGITPRPTTQGGAK